MASSLRSFYNGCDLVLVPTDVMRNDLKQIGVLGAKMKLWQRGLDKTIFNPGKANPEVSHSITGNSKPNVLFASRLVWEKNLETLIQINEINNEAGRPYNIIVAGDGIARQELQRKMKHAFFTGSVSQSQLAAFYASARVFLFPSISETYGNVVAEAMSCGTPCVIGNGGGTTTFIENNETGFVIEPFKAKDYHDALLKIINDGRLYSHLALNCINQTRFLNWESLAEEFYHLLKGLTVMNETVHPSSAA